MSAPSYTLLVVYDGPELRWCGKATPQTVLLAERFRWRWAALARARQFRDLRNVVVAIDGQVIRGPAR